MHASFENPCGVHVAFPLSQMYQPSGPRSEGVRRPAEGFKASDEPKLKCSRGIASRRSNLSRRSWRCLIETKKLILNPSRAHVQLGPLPLHPLVRIAGATPGVSPDRGFFRDKLVSRKELNRLRYR